MDRTLAQDAIMTCQVMLQRTSLACNMQHMPAWQSELPTNPPCCDCHANKSLPSSPHNHSEQRWRSQACPTTLVRCMLQTCFQPSAILLQQTCFTRGCQQPESNRSCLAACRHNPGKHSIKSITGSCHAGWLLMCSCASHVPTPHWQALGSQLSHSCPSPPQARAHARIHTR